MKNLLNYLKPQKKFLVFLHIEKTAGTTFRSQFYSMYGIDKVFWHNIDGISPSFEIDPYQKKNMLVIGGHQMFAFYPLNLAQFYFMAILRDPLTRSLSLYNYFKKIVKNSKNPNENSMVLEGKFNPDSLIDTLKNSHFFNNQIQNRQCRYLSGTSSAAKTIEHIRKFPFLIGTQENLEVYTEFCQQTFNWPRYKFPKYNCAEENYQSGLELNTESRSIINELTKEDKLLHEYVTQQKIIFDPFLWKKTKAFQLKSNFQLPIYPPCFNLNYCAQKKENFQNLNEKTLRINIEIENLEDRYIPPGKISKLFITHQWYRQGEKYLHQDNRSLLPFELKPKETTPIEISVNLPTEGGDYILLVTFIQDSLAWHLKGTPHQQSLKFPITISNS